MTLDFQDYEIENILKALEESYLRALGKWGMARGYKNVLLLTY